MNQTEIFSWQFRLNHKNIPTPQKNAQNHLGTHQLPQKESGGKLYGSRSRQLSESAPSKRIWRKIIWLQIPPTF